MPYTLRSRLAGGAGSPAVPFPGPIDCWGDNLVLGVGTNATNTQGWPQQLSMLRGGITIRNWGRDVQSSQNCAALQGGKPGGFLVTGGSTIFGTNAAVTNLTTAGATGGTNFLNVSESMVGTLYVGTTATGVHGTLTRAASGSVHTFTSDATVADVSAPATCLFLSDAANAATGFQIVWCGRSGTKSNMLGTNASADRPRVREMAQWIDTHAVDGLVIGVTQRDGTAGTPDSVADRDFIYAYNDAMAVDATLASAGVDFWDINTWLCDNTTAGALYAAQDYPAVMFDDASPRDATKCRAMKVASAAGFTVGMAVTCSGGATGGVVKAVSTAFNLVYVKFTSSAAGDSGNLLGPGSVPTTAITTSYAPTYPPLVTVYPATGAGFTDYATAATAHVPTVADNNEIPADPFWDQDGGGTLAGEDGMNMPDWVHYAIAKYINALIPDTPAVPGGGSGGLTALPVDHGGPALVPPGAGVYVLGRRHQTASIAAAPPVEPPTPDPEGNLRYGDALVEYGSALPVSYGVAA